MSIHHWPDAGEVERAAGEWIARLDAQDVTAEDLTRFEVWRAAHPRHARAYEEISATVAEVKRMGRLVRAVSFGNAMDAAALQTNERKNHRRGSRWGFAAAAAIAALAVAGIWWAGYTDPQTAFQTGIGEHASVELPDGSRLELNSNSMARVDFTPQTRTIRLTRGEAFFQVAHEPQRPFWVVAGDSWIRAVGTAFNVDLQPSGVRVLVSEGTVKVTTGRRADASPSDASLAQASASVLTAGQHVELKDGSAQIRPVLPLELTRVAAWRKGKLYFENQRLDSVLDELSRYTAARIVVEDEALRRLPIGGTFQANPQGVESLLQMLEQGFALRVRREADGRVYIENSGK